MTNSFLPHIEPIGQDTPKISIFGQLGVLAGILLLIFGSGYAPKVLESLSAPEPEESLLHTPKISNTQSTEEETRDYFKKISIQAEAAYVWDVQNQKVLYGKNDREQLPLASVTKLMTALVAHEILAEETKINITDSAIQQDGNSGLMEGESFSLLDILNLTLLSSSNDGAYAVAAAAGANLTDEGGADTFVEAMNIRASELGLNQTYFKNPTGLDISKTEGGAYGSARDVAFLMEHILQNHPGILEHTQKTSAEIDSENGIAHSIENTNPTVSRIDGLIGSKTGYTDIAGGNLAIAFDAAYNRPIIVVVLGSTYTSRFEDVLALSDAARQTVN